MTKSHNALAEAVRSPKHPFHQVDSQPDKPQKHRYERRKVKQILHHGDWSEEGEMDGGAPPS